MILIQLYQIVSIEKIVLFIFSILVFHVSGVQVFDVKPNDLGICCYVFLFISNFVNLYAFALFLLVSFEKRFVHPDDFLKEPNICCLILCLVLFDFFIDFSFEFDYFLLSIYLLVAVLLFEPELSDMLLIGEYEISTISYEDTHNYEPSS